MRFKVQNSFLKSRPIYIFLLLLLLFCLGAFALMKRLEPEFWSRVESYAVIKSENAVNDAVTEVLSTNNIKYSDLVNLSTYQEGGISALNTDIVKVNLLKSELSKKITQKISDSKNGYIYINLGAISKTPLLAGIGPKIRIKIMPSNQTIIEFKNSFTESGINQVKHTIYLEISVNLTLTTAISQKHTNFKTIIPIADTVIVGTVPKYYGSTGMHINGEDYETDRE